MTAPSRASRRAAQRRDRRRAQVRRIGAALVVLALLAAAFGVYQAVRDPEPPASAGPSARTESTVLFQVRGADGEAVSNALLAHDPRTGTGSVVLVPPQVIVNVPGTGSETLGRTLLTAAPATVQAAFSDLAGVVVDEGWTVSLPGVAALVDALGGITVDVDVPVVQGGAALLSPGAQRVDGARAAAFLTYLAPDEQEQGRLARIQEVLDGLLDVLPATPAELGARLQALGEGSVSGLPPPRLAAFLLGLAAADEAGRLQYDVLPVVPIDAGGGVMSFRIDPQRTTALVDRLFAGSVQPGAREKGNRVLVLNGVGTPGLGEAVRSRLVPAGFVFVGSRNAPSFGVVSTQVLVPSATVESQALGERVARAIGVPPTSVATQQFGSVADVVVLVGADFKP